MVDYDYYFKVRPSTYDSYIDIQLYRSIRASLFGISYNTNIVQLAVRQNVAKDKDAIQNNINELKSKISIFEEMYDQKIALQRLNMENMRRESERLASINRFIQDIDGKPIEK
jgi:hypothetical protein